MAIIPASGNFLCCFAAVLESRRWSSLKIIKTGASSFEADCRLLILMAVPILTPGTVPNLIPLLTLLLLALPFFPLLQILLFPLVLLTYFFDR
jgi:hypothetical protein